MTDSVQQRASLDAGFAPGSTWMAAMEVEHLVPGGSIVLDPNRIAFPGPLSQAKPGSYQVMALLDPNHSYAYHGQDEGDFSSQVIRIENLNPADSKPVELTLSRITPARGPRLTETDQVKLVEFESPMLSTFWGRSITMRAGVVLPPGYTTETARNYPAAYHIHGFGGEHRGAWGQGQSLVKAMAEGKQPQVEASAADARTDIFALGAVLYEMITGRRAFTGKSHASLVAAILKRDPEPMSTIQPMTPPALVTQGHIERVRTRRFE